MSLPEVQPLVLGIYNLKNLFCCQYYKTTPREMHSTFLSAISTKFPAHYKPPICTVMAMEHAVMFYWLREVVIKSDGCYKIKRQITLGILTGESVPNLSILEDLLTCLSYVSGLEVPDQGLQANFAFPGNANGKLKVGWSGRRALILLKLAG